MAFSPTITHDSKSLPCVRFTVHRIGYGRRVGLDMKTLSLRQRLRELEADSPPETPKEKELSEQIAIARKKALALPSEQWDAVIKQDLDPLLAEYRTSADSETRKLRSSLTEEYQSIVNQIQMVWIRDCLISIEGGELDGMTVDQLLEYGPPPLAQEISEALVNDGRLTRDAAKNSPSLGTSGAVVPAQATITTAPTAESSPSGQPETVSATTQSA
jgi:hypothetical protein